jgi:hypothetical protein
MMEFRLIKNQVVKILGDAAGSRFQVVGYKRQTKSADEILNNDRMVQVYFSDGSFPKSAGRMHSEKAHDISIEIDLSASAAAHGNLTVLDDPVAPAYEKAAAILAIKEAAEIADGKIDDLIEWVYQILMDARNIDLKLEKGQVNSRWIDRIQKDVIIERGDLVVKTANMKYTCRCTEIVLGDIGVEPDPVIIDTALKINDIETTGVKVENTN